MPVGASENSIERLGETFASRSGSLAGRTLRRIGSGCFRTALRGQVRLLGDQVGDRFCDLGLINSAVIVNLELLEVDESECVCGVGELAGCGSSNLGADDTRVCLGERLAVSHTLDPFRVIGG